ncbi:short-chain dehydrogenase/reductase SDR (plasmid) [Haloterrigena turkmenica DSM 5511]|uniref:Short-chain dehydrogenase/reductase SDR n=1 Tax=Haloterrigena turkmenica (strain ATCC 51198 / DSM 5511 / JCM 9101 / NCIMB 13204 / VKM B-1734 / 4k) TaxID=543526 RepID=D2S0Q6_HALTV|nr:3-oxoacyl-ACP reductase FabG [Haloterrigena turkmenica]ADB62953.1 short-chain dehydrogenase/reductase SDR [Haloterrigena turkmenica DSM 5511]
MSEGRFAGEVAVVTGGTRGIGLATAERLAAGGARTIVTYHSNEEAAADAAATLDSYDAPTAVKQFDVSDFESVIEAFERITDEHGRPTVLVNNAGRMDNGLVVRMGPEQWSSVLETNLTGAFYCTREAARRMLRGEGGRIVNVASVAGLSGWTGQANYAASKAGLIGLTRAVARELGDRSIRVNAVAPGYVDTQLYEEHIDDGEVTDDRIASGRAADPAEVADVIAFLASEEASYVNGAVYRVDDGFIS